MHRKEIQKIVSRIRRALLYTSLEVICKMYISKSMLKKTHINLLAMKSVFVSETSIWVLI
jgi:hypothetical protein